ncbi:hypothetical protein [Streptomyces sp. bgisy084]|uniref:hypothetical protein n=1 Tax=Streptomyces sp. bgisy084 TaxID=3413777 RepID=UPI003D73979B
MCDKLVLLTWGARPIKVGEDFPTGVADLGSDEGGCELGHTHRPLKPFPHSSLLAICLWWLIKYLHPEENSRFMQIGKERVESSGVGSDANHG